MAHILQWQPTGPWDGRNRKSCQERKRRKTHRDQKCVSVSIATHRQSQQPGAPGVIKQREKGVEWGWPRRHSLQRGKKKWGKEKEDAWMIPRTTDINLSRAINVSWQMWGVSYSSLLCSLKSLGGNSLFLVNMLTSRFKIFCSWQTLCTLHALASCWCQSQTISSVGGRVQTSRLCHAQWIVWLTAPTSIWVWTVKFCQTEVRMRRRKAPSAKRSTCCRSFAQLIIKCCFLTEFDQTFLFISHSPVGFNLISKLVLPHMCVHSADKSQERLCVCSLDIWS